jgi:hypothetical protein
MFLHKCGKNTRLAGLHIDLESVGSLFVWLSFLLKCLIIGACSYFDAEKLSDESRLAGLHMDLVSVGSLLQWLSFSFKGLIIGTCSNFSVANKSD